jgi:dihydrofolate reductase
MERIMRKLVVFSHVSLDGFFVDANGGMSWAKSERNDAEWNAFVADNTKGGGPLLFGRVTYQLMASYWPTPMADHDDPIVADRMNTLPKVVFSRTLDKPSWRNTTLVKGDLATEVRKMKEQSGGGMVILGSGTIVSQLAQLGLIDEYQIAMNPIILGKGRTLFEGVTKQINLKLTKLRAFRNGNVFLGYELA